MTGRLRGSAEWGHSNGWLACGKSGLVNPPGSRGTQLLAGQNWHTHKQAHSCLAAASSWANNPTASCCKLLWVHKSPSEQAGAHAPDGLLILSVQVNHLLLRAALERRQRCLGVHLLMPRLLKRRAAPESRVEGKSV